MRDEHKIIGQPDGWIPETDADHFCVCPGCGALIDMRDLEMALRHAGELPHQKETPKS